ncbi:hypothetical protein [cf. Phormidesmis sp. LEGE 11477]|uniref:hypothetical protein n=1 Tax=cf. Phormidesmis sp. LEGE 11477 TaxID=1828680 RepID=UPI0018821B94|nr:hypothetical protein [cf. Phormidesmis sp. LEGE 11477]MBE9061026.1 hypothetical protein [cf. Phormidesmis sp. LEGE 11477]
MRLSLIKPRRAKISPTVTWFERVMAMIALVNLVLVLFDLSYIRFRDLYLEVIPNATIWYGEKLKGIEPERTTTAYLAVVDQLSARVADGVDTPAEQLSVDRLLAQLREQSVAMIDEDPFAVANKSGTLEQIKNEMRDRMDEDSSKAAFSEFWQGEPVSNSDSDLSESIAFFDEEIRPLMETNYYRGINERGNPIDLFWRIDIWFMALFAAEFLARTYVLSRRRFGTSWLDAMLWRVYDVPMFLGFWRWLRIIPVTVRLHRARWIDLEPARNRVSRAIVSQFAVELTEIVLLRTIDQMQRLIREGAISRWLLTATDRNQYVDINGVDEVQTIAKHLSDTVVYQVLPKVKPELDALLQHSVVSALHQAPAYQGLSVMPGFEGFTSQISGQIVAELSKTLNSALQSALADEKGGELAGNLVASFGNQLRSELRQEETLAEIRTLVVDLLEEIKINYVDRLAAEEADQLEASRYRLYEATGRSRRPIPPSSM